MRRRTGLVLSILMIVMLACSLTATPGSLPPQPAPSPASPPPSASEAAPFTGTWIGPDPDDGSEIIISLAQRGTALGGQYSDSYSPDAAPGYTGPVAGSTLTSTTGQITMNVSRPDGSSLVLHANLSLVDQDTLKVTLTPTDASSWFLKRQ